MALLADRPVGHPADVFGRCREEIMAEWRLQADKLLRALQLDRAPRTEHLPDLVAEITRNLAFSHEGTLPARLTHDSAAVPGGPPFCDALGLEEVIAEYNLLRVAFTTVAGRHGFLMEGETSHIIDQCIDEAIRLRVMAYAEQQAFVCRTCRERRDEHLAFITHDLRTPLNAVCLAVEELSASMDPKALLEAGDFIEILRRNLQHMAGLVKKVMDTNAQPSQMSTSFRPELRTFDLWPLVQRLIVDLRPVSLKNGITVTNDISRALTVYADAGLLLQVFQNLLSNAFKYADHGRVSVSAHDDAGSVTCVVRDNGAGIPPEMLDKVFEKFASDPAKEGKGLGLAIVKQIVEAHGGTVSVESTQGEGATFSFTIPDPAETITPAFRYARAG